MAKKVSLRKYLKIKETATPMIDIYPDTTYDLYQRWGRYGYPEVSEKVKLSPEDCWIIGSVKVWVFTDMLYSSLGMNPESYLEDWFLIESSQS